MVVPIQLDLSSAVPILKNWIRPAGSKIAKMEGTAVKSGKNFWTEIGIGDWKGISKKILIGQTGICQFSLEIRIHPA